MNRYIRAVSLNFLFFIFNTIFFLIITPVAIHVMGGEFYGLFSILNALMLLSNIGTLGISAIVNKFASEANTPGRTEEQHFGEVLTAGTLIVIPMALLFAGMIALMRNLIANNLEISPLMRGEFSKAMLIVAIGVFPQFLSKVPAGFLLSQLKNGVARGIEFISSFSLWIGAVGIVFFVKRDLTWIALWYLITSILVLFAYYFAIPRHLVSLSRVDLRIVRKMLNFSGNLFIESLAISLFQQMDRVIVGLTLGPVAAGTYSIGTSVGLRMSLITGQMTDVMVPYASLKESLNDRVRLLAIFRHLSRYVSLLVAGLGGLLILWMNQILSVWISVDFARQYTNMFGMLIVAYSLLSLSRAGHQTLTGMGRVRFTSLVYLLSTGIMLGGVYVFSSKFGLFGAASANCFMILLLVYNIAIYKILTNEKFSWRAVFGDLKWGFFLPAVIFGFLSLNHTLLFKIEITFALVAVLFIVLLRDDWTKLLLARQLKNIYPKPSEN
jgi:O-antigen/teichoic acid export membrane protein